MRGPLRVGWVRRNPTQPPGSGRRLPSLRNVLLTLAGVGVMGIALLGQGSLGNLTSTINNNGSSAASTGYFTCKAAALGGAAGTPAYFAYPLAEAIGLNATDVSGNGRTGTYTLLGITYSQSGPCPRDSPASTAVALNGSTGYISGPTATQSNPTVFSVEIWFQTTTAAGKLIGFGSSRTGSSTSYDRHIYLDTGGHLVFGVYPGAYKTIASTAVVTDGAWHNVIGTLSSAGLNLYLDGALVASDTTTTTAQNFVGYWRIGYDNLGTWPGVPTSSYFNGKLAWASVYTYALTASQARAHYKAGV